ncbi:hypothetical protein BJ165DRAFT_1530069 [Panaeolus papilionaceus]|nr:hypothetical protein BJ165DRAFT_1530069 [Panaeolus papilionaceus]
MTPLAPNDTPTPSLPFELFDYIVDIIGWQPSDTPLTVEQRTSLQSISLINKSFVALARTHLFRNVPIDLVGMNKTRLNALVQLVETKSELSNFIRGINIDLDVSQLDDNDQLDSTALEQYKQFLFGLPNLHALTVFYPNCEEMEEEPENPYSTNLRQFCDNIMDELARRGTLCYLNTTNVEQLPLTISACSALRSLRVENGGLVLPTVLQRSDSLTKLSLIEMDVPISVLSSFPNLEELYLLWTNLLPFQEQPGTSTTLPFGLKKFTYSNGVGDTTPLSLISTTFHHQALSRGSQAFRFLQTITLEFGDRITDDSSGIWALLEESIRLRDLSIKGKFNVYGTTWLTSPLKVSQCLERVLGHLHSLSMIIVPPVWNETSTLIESLYPLLASFPPDNELTHLHLTLRRHFFRTISLKENLDLDPQRKLTSLLTTCSAFRRLETVTIGVESALYVAGTRSICEAEFSSRMAIAVEEFQTRCNMSSSYKMWLSEGGATPPEHTTLIKFEPHSPSGKSGMVSRLDSHCGTPSKI